MQGRVGFKAISCVKSDWGVAVLRTVLQRSSMSVSSSFFAMDNE